MNESDSSVSSQINESDKCVRDGVSHVIDK